MKLKNVRKMWEGQPSPIPRSESVFAPPLPPITYLERITATVTHPRPLSVGDGSDIAQNALAGRLDGCFAGPDMLNLGCITNIADLGVLGVQNTRFVMLLRWGQIQGFGDCVKAFYAFFLWCIYNADIDGRMRRFSGAFFSACVHSVGHDCDTAGS